MSTHIEYLPQQAQLLCRGDWTIDSIAVIEPFIQSLHLQVMRELVIDGEGIERIDSAGAMLLFRLVRQLSAAGTKITTCQLTPECQSLLDLVKEQQAMVFYQVPRGKVFDWLYIIGHWAVAKYNEILCFIAFVGEFMLSFFDILCRPSHIAWKAILKTIDEAGYQALPIVGLLTFLVGVVVTYQVAGELMPYGADIYIVDLTGMIIFREFGPLITAIIAAGRTSTAFASVIGTMQVSEEIDALATFGIPPYERLVVPRFIGLLIALPLLTVWANVFGIVGAMVTAKAKMGIGYIAFIQRFQYQVEVRHYIAGLVKVPVFAMIVALVGCFQGFQVQRSADSVGAKTTKSAVQSIFLIIIADAIFSVLFNLRGM